MKLYTIQMGKWRIAEEKGIPLYNVALKGGDRKFAPSWRLLKGYKAGEISNEEYTHQYTKEMRTSYRLYKEHWENFIKDNDEIGIACYCGAGSFCHRYLLADFLEKLCKKHNVEFIRGGEL